jgi:hypothetical protein
MKKVFLALMILAMAVPAFADWQVTVSGWTMSPGPDLAYEQVRMDGVAVTGCDNILPGDSKSCVFNITSKTDQAITIRSFDSAANFADHTIGTIGSGPNPASGGTITVIWQ